MRKSFCIAILLLFSVVAEAQFAVGGSLGLSTTTEKIDGERQSDAFKFDVLPSIGYAVGDWEFGLGFEYTYSKTKWSGTDSRTETESVFALGPYADYTFASVGKFDFALEASSMFGFADDERTIHLQLLPLATYVINDRWDFDIFSDILSLNYLWTKTDADKRTVGKFDFLANNGRVFALGFTYKF